MTTKLEGFPYYVRVVRLRDTSPPEAKEFLGREGAAYEYDCFDVVYVTIDGRDLIFFRDELEEREPDDSVQGG